MGWMMKFIPIGTIVTYLAGKLLGVNKKTLQKFVDRTAAVANEKIDGIAKKNKVVDQMGDIAEDIIKKNGTWALNLLIELAVALIKRNLPGRTNAGPASS